MELDIVIGKSIYIVSCPTLPTQLCLDLQVPARQVYRRKEASNLIPLVSPLVSISTQLLVSARVHTILKMIRAQVPQH